ncbi:MAG: hypothetical protein DCC54_03835 [Anaerolineae bacterium]|nr:MAG: hypothetical protein DCC54_03835 [Anaerolineae bacterium]
MNLTSIWSVLEESSEILFGNYAYPAADKVAEELALPPNFYNWVMASNLAFGYKTVHCRAVHEILSIRTAAGK